MRRTLLTLLFTVSSVAALPSPADAAALPGYSYTIAKNAKAAASELEGYNDALDSAPASALIVVAWAHGHPVARSASQSLLGGSSRLDAARQLVDDVLTEESIRARDHKGVLLLNTAYGLGFAGVAELISVLEEHSTLQLAELASVIWGRMPPNPDAPAVLHSVYNRRVALRASLSTLAESVAEPFDRDPTALATALENLEPRRLLVVLTALAQVSKPYEPRTYGPSTYDCGGLMFYAWRAGGVDLTTWDQRGQVEYKPEEEMLPGDLVFWDHGWDPVRQRNAQHVAMLLGSSGLMVEAFGGANNPGVRVALLRRRGLEGFGHVPLL
jgi:hypothetical protein